MRQSSTFRLLVILAMAVEVAALAQPAPKTRVTYSEAYGKTGTPPELTAKDMPRFPAVERSKVWRWPGRYNPEM